MAAVNWVALTKAVLRGVPFQFTVMPLTKLVPVTVKVNAAAPAVCEAGFKLVIWGTPFTVKTPAFEVTPSGVTTLTLAVVGAAMSLAEIAAVNWVALTKVVVRGVPFQLTISPLTKLVPFTAKAKAAAPAVRELGFRLVRVRP